MSQIFGNDEKPSIKDSFYTASQWQLMWRKFRKHKLAIVGGGMLAVLYISAIFCEFFSPYDIFKRYEDHIYAPPQRIRFFDENGFHLRPFVYRIEGKLDLTTFRRIYTEDKSRRFPLYFLVYGDPYKLWDLFKADLHLFGVEEAATVFLFGTDSLGRDLFSRNLFGARISVSVGMVGVALSFILGCGLGGISGFFGGKTDTVIQRFIEILISIPTIPLWMALSAAVPLSWSPIKVYFGITVILSIVGWCGLARVVRGKLISLREEDFATAARIAGATEGRIIVRHLLPSFFSYLIVSLTLAVPGMILGETSLSFLGLGLRPPIVSWGTLLKEAQSASNIIFHPWLLIAGVSVIVTVLAFNFLGDGLRDAADPYK